MTKDIIRNNFDKLYKFRDNTYYRNTSGGSTGEPVIFYQDRNCLEREIATKILFDEWTGRKIGEPMVKLWGSSLQDILRSGQGFKGYLRQQLYGVTILSSSRMAEKDMYRYVQRINNTKPGLILAYTNGIDKLACFIQENCLSIYSPKAIMTSAGVLYPEVRAQIEKVFQAPVFNRYGSREVGDIACNCEKNQGLHVVPNVHHIEILDEQDKEAKPGERGEIVVTLLTNYTMPLIRYKIGDRGILSEMECSCGWGFPLLKKVEGRVRSVFKNKQGDFIDGGVFIRLFYFRDNIKQFQCCKRFQKNKCDNPKENYWNDDICCSCDDFLDNGLRGILSKHLMTLGFVIDDDGYVSYGGEGTLDIDQLVTKMREEVSIEVVEELLPEDIISKGEDMSGVYTFLYCIENSFRIFVDNVLIEEFGDEYTDKNTIPEKIKRKIEGRKKEEKSNKWLSIRGGNDLFYTDLDELGNIIITNWAIFEKHFPDQNWIIGKITEISKCRHLVAHHSYIKRDERDLLGVYYKQILKQIQISK